MKPLILSENVPLEFLRGGLADAALNTNFFRFSWGRQPSQQELAHHLGPRTASHDSDAMHWSEWCSWNKSKNRRYSDVSLNDFCRRYETVALWFDPRPEAQLQLVWLLDYFSAFPESVARLELRLLDRDLLGIEPVVLEDWDPPAVDVTDKELATAKAVWQAYRSPTPEACVQLLRRDLSALPLLKPVLLDLMAELPSASSGLGATEMRMLEMIGRGYSLTNALFYVPVVRQTRVFNEIELGYLLEGLAFGPKPAVLGLDEELRTLPRHNYRDRGRAFQRSRLSLTDLGRAVLAHQEDFSRHNPIDRWWGGTHLTNDNLWRWSPALVKP